MIESLLSRKPELDPVAARKLLFTQIIGIAVVLVLTLIVYASVLYGSLPFWLALAAFAAQGWAVSNLIGRIQRLRKMTR